MITLSRFDKLVFLTLAGLFVMTGLLAWRGEQPGVAIITRSPAPGAENVSTRTLIRVTFDHAIDIARFATKSFSSLPLPLLIQPPVTGTVRWKGSIMTFTPTYPLEPEKLYTVTVAENLKSLQGRSLQGERQWQFTTRRPYLLYLAPDQNDVMRLSMIDPATKLARRLSQTSSNVEDYALSPDSSTLVWTISNPYQGSDLWSVRLDSHKHSRVLKCKQDACSHAVWRPDGTRLVYERKASEDEKSRLWWLDLTSGDTVPVFENVERVSYGAGWSPDGTWLSYIEPKREELHVYNLKDGRHFNIPNQLGEPPVWHPRQNVLIFSDMLLKGGKMVVHLFRVDPEQGELQDISGEMNLVEDRFPTWSPDGSWIACTRKITGNFMGKQLVMMRPDGSELFPLTHDPLYDHSHPVWSPDDRDLVFQRSPVQDVMTPSGIWVLDLSTGQTREMLTPGKQATWLP